MHPFKIIEYKSVESTNTLAKNLFKENKIECNTVLFAYEQTAGKGQKNNQWITQKEKNIICSIIIDISFLNPNNLFSLINAVAVSCYQYVKEKIHFPHNNLSIKWVNDLYYTNKKLGGILIENIIKNKTSNYSIIGVGLNINQIHFNDSILKKAISLQNITQQHYNLIEELNTFLSIFYSNLFQLQQDSSSMLNTYNDLLFKKNEWQKFIYKNKVIEGKIINTNSLGQLGLLKNEQITYYDYDTLEWIFE